MPADTNERMETRSIGDIMIPLEDYPHLPVWSTLREAIQIMHGAEIKHRGRVSLPRTVLLFDLDGSIAGTVRRRDLMRGLEPEFLVSEPLEYRKKLFDVDVDPNLSEMSYDKMIKGIREQADRPVTDILRPIETTINVQDHLMKAIYELVGRGLTVLPVLDRGKVVGVIRTVDVFHELAEIVLPKA